MRAIVCGDHTWDDREAVWYILDRLPHLYGFEITVLIEGGARGVDTYARQWAEKHDIPFYERKANWKKYGYSAGPIRNGELIAYYDPEAVVAFPGGRGTANMVKRAREKGIPVYEVGGALNERTKSEDS